MIIKINTTNNNNKKLLLKDRNDYNNFLKTKIKKG